MHEFLLNPEPITAAKFVEHCKAMWGAPWREHTCRCLGISPSTLSRIATAPEGQTVTLTQTCAVYYLLHLHASKENTFDMEDDG